MTTGNEVIIDIEDTYGTMVHEYQHLINYSVGGYNIDTWLKELKLHSNPDAKVFLIGNKQDLEESRVVSKEEGEKYAKELGINSFMETSAKTGFNAQNVFIEAAKLLYDDYQKYKDKTETASTNGSFRQTFVSITDGDTKVEKKKCNC